MGNRARLHHKLRRKKYKAFPPWITASIGTTARTLDSKTMCSYFKYFHRRDPLFTRAQFKAEVRVGPPTVKILQTHNIPAGPQWLHESFKISADKLYGLPERETIELCGSYGKAFNASVDELGAKIDEFLNEQIGKIVLEVSSE